MKRSPSISLSIALLGAFALVGCQTSPKNTVAVAETAEAPGSRQPASLSPLRTILSNLEQVEHARVLAKMNLYRDAELARFGKITPENIDKLDRENPLLAAKIAKMVANSSDFAALFASRPALRQLTREVENLINSGGVRGAVTDAGTSGRTTGPILNPGRRDNGIVAMEYFAQMRMSEEFINHPNGAKIIDDLTKNENEARRLTGKSWVREETCRNLKDNPEAAQKLNELIEDVNKYAREGGQLCPDVEAWLFLKFQQKLGRNGPAAYNAVVKSASCAYGPEGIDVAARRLASANGDQIPDRPPPCR